MKANIDGKKQANNKICTIFFVLGYYFSFQVTIQVAWKKGDTLIKILYSIHFISEFIYAKFKLSNIYIQFPPKFKIYIIIKNSEFVNEILMLCLFCSYPQKIEIAKVALKLLNCRRYPKGSVNDLTKRRWRKKMAFLKLLLGLNTTFIYTELIVY